MTAEEYIALTKRIIPVWEYRYKDIMPQIFKSIKDIKVLGRQYTADMELKMISSTSIFSEVVSTVPGPTIIWDSYQWEIVEKFLVAGLAHKNGNEDAAMIILKENLYAALSVRLTTVAPELSYIFAKKYRSILDEDPNRYVGVVSDTIFMDLLHCGIISLGHEMCHIIFSSNLQGKALYKLIKKDFFSIMSGVLKTELAFEERGENWTIKDLIFLIQQERNKEYLKEIICDSFAFQMLGDTLWTIEQRISNNRSKGEMLDDILALYDFVIRTLNTLNYNLEFWTRFGSLGTTHRYIKKEYLHSNIPNFSIWSEQYWAREELTSLYTRLVFLRDEDVAVEGHNERYLAMYNSVTTLFRKLLTFSDDELAKIIVESDRLLRMNINPSELIEARNGLLGI